ncbi:MAG: hypothetical protein LUC98_12405 [Lachnospiraceae bacterium]|nr:hypothetical protein [Lachnospiraceae bacterium]
MGQKEIRLLRANEIECRVGFISAKGLSLLLYKDARVDMKILDEVYGANNWQRRHEVIGGNLYCTVSIWDEEKKQWISKMDVGTKSNTEKEKGEASDSFKRACFSHGIGRELYTAPFIWVGAGRANIQARENRYVTSDKFKVASISYNENREIMGLTVINQEGKVVYNLVDKAAAQKQNTARSETTGPDIRNQEAVDAGKQAAANTEAINRELARTGVALDTILQRYGISNLGDMDEGTYRKAMNSLRHTKSKAA